MAACAAHQHQRCHGRVLLGVRERGQRDVLHIEVRRGRRLLNLRDGDAGARHVRQHKHGARFAGQQRVHCAEQRRQAVGLVPARATIIDNQEGGRTMMLRT